MNSRDPLTYVYPRTLRETRRDPYEWWTTAEAAVAEEEHIKAMFNERPKPRDSAAWAELCIYLIATCVAIAFVLGAFR